MNNNFYNVAASFWGKNLIGCSSCSTREKTTPLPNEMPLMKPKKEYSQAPADDVLNTSSNINNLSQVSFDSNENLSSDMTALSYPIKFSGNPKGKAWSKEEDDLLKEAVKFFNGKNWKQIATKVIGRSSTQCSQRWRRIQPYKNRFPWTSEEDYLLADLVHKYGQNWSIIASSLPGRTGKQVRERFLNNLDPTINRNKFSPEEDENIIELYTKFGPKWKEMTKEFSGRTENMIKNRFYSHIKKKMLLKYPHKYKKALEKAQTELSLNNFSSPKDNMKSWKIENGQSDKISGKEDFSEFEENLKQKYQKLELLDFLKNNADFKIEMEQNSKFNNNNQNTMELEDNNKISDGFLNLYRNSINTPKKNEFYKSIFSPMNQKIPEIAFDAPLIKQEIELENNHHEGFMKMEEPSQYQKYEGELIESKNALLNNFFNLKEFESREIFGKNKMKIDEEIKNSSVNADEKLLSQKNYLLNKKTRLEDMIKEIAGKIQHHSNSQNL